MTNTSQSYRSQYIEVPMVSFGQRTEENTEALKPASSVSKIPSFTSLTFQTGSQILRSSRRRCHTILEGPRRVAKLCLVCLILPVLFFSIPIYVRFVLFPARHFTMAPTDQRLLGQHSSSVWCQSQKIQMNGSFNAFLLHENPRIRKNRTSHSMVQHLVLKDDVKEFWGFFLLKDSVVTINLCNRYDGGMLMIMRGTRNLKKCSWIGEEDSAEQDEDHKDTSNESGQLIESENGSLFLDGKIDVGVIQENQTSVDVESKSFGPGILSSGEKMAKIDGYIDKLISLGESKQDIIKHIKRKKIKLKNLRKYNRKSKIKSKLSDSFVYKNDRIYQKRGDNIPIKVLRIKRYLSDISVTEGIEDLEESTIYSITNNKESYEISNDVKEAYLNLFNLPRELKYERGTINQTTWNDQSNEEHRSSFSSSEEALTKCEGIIAAIPLYPTLKCNSIANSIVNHVKYRIPKTGKYYFVFSSDNEVFDSDIYFNMTLERVVFDTDSAFFECRNERDCSLNLQFWSQDQAVVEVLEQDWNSAYYMEIKCQPRVWIYLIFIFFIPLLIVFVAYY